MVTTYVRRAVGRPESERVSPVSAIDDLIKFRLVESMLRQPDTAASARELAARLGFYSVDNLPIPLLPKFADLTRESKKRAALIIDIREGDELERFPEIEHRTCDRRSDHIPDDHEISHLPGRRPE